ncbi:MAG: hypothetical protein JWM30_3468 [Burkholderia sp.]|jgi:hypothetical protein|nr:hypothetical protein [Burkholderia sp.]
MSQTADYKGYKITATAQQRGGEWYGNFVREKDGDTFRSGMTVMHAGSQEDAEAQLLELARAQVHALET